MNDSTDQPQDVDGLGRSPCYRAKVVDYKIVSFPIRGIPPGEYTGTWSGYVVKLNYEGSQFEFITDVGVRTPSTPCVIQISCDGIMVEAR